MAEVRPVSATSAREWIETGEQCMESRLFDQVRTRHSLLLCIVVNRMGSGIEVLQKRKRYPKDLVGGGQPRRVEGERMPSHRGHWWVQIVL